MSERQGLEEFLEQKDYEFEAVAAEFPCIAGLEAAPQDAVWHGEGNVLEHTRRVCLAVTAGEEWHKLSRRDRAILYTAALFHDLGKKDCTTEEDGRIISPNHSVVGMRGGVPGDIPGFACQKSGYMDEGGEIPWFFQLTSRR